MTKKTIFNSLIVVVVIFFLWTSFIWKIFSCGLAGSQACVETWKFEISEKDLIKIIEEIKEENPEIDPTITTFKDGRKEYWYYIYFYYPDNKEIVSTWTRQSSDTSITRFALNGIFTTRESPKPTLDSLVIRRGLDHYDYKGINTDFNYFTNKYEIWKFEKNILELINEKIERRYKSGI